MSNAKKLFDENMTSLKNFDVIYSFISENAPVLDSSYLLRAKYVLVVSALDTYMHEIVIEKTIHNFFNNMLPSETDVLLSINTAQCILNESDNFNQRQLLISELRKIMSSYSFQAPKSIEYALSLLGFKKIWSMLSGKLGMSGQDIHDTLSLIVYRRNKIAHESDLDPHTRKTMDIDQITITDCTEFIEKLVTGIDDLIEAPSKLGGKALARVPGTTRILSNAVVNSK